MTLLLPHKRGMERAQIQILKAGRHRAMTGPLEVDAAMLGDVVATFDADVPVTAGHLTTDGDPALGWVTRVWMAGDAVEAEVELPDETVAAIKRRRAYRWVSPGLRRDAESGWRWRLDHLALLGARRPAQRNIRALFAAGEQAATDTSRPEQGAGEPQERAVVAWLEAAELTFGWRDERGEQEERARMDVQATAQAAPQATAEATAPSRSEQPEVALLTALQSEVAQLRDALAAERRARRRLEIERRIGPLLQDGRLAQADLDRVVALGEALEGDTVQLAGTPTSALDVLLDLLGRLPAAVATGRAIDPAELARGGASANLAAPSGWQADPQRLELARRADALVAAGRAPDFVAAVRLIEAGSA